MFLFDFRTEIQKKLDKKKDETDIVSIDESYRIEHDSKMNQMQPILVMKMHSMHIDQRIDH